MNSFRVRHALSALSALGTIIVSMSWATGQSPPNPTTSPNTRASERVVVIDLRAVPEPTAPDAAEHTMIRQALFDALRPYADIDTGIAPRGSELDQALAGRLQSPLAKKRQAALKRLAEVATAFGKLDCTAADVAGEHAVLALSSLLAARQDVTAPLQQAHVYQLLCAHNRGDSDRAMWVRTKLEQLGVFQAPFGVSALVWNLYPPLDATANANIVEATITSAPEGAQVWLNHRSIGPAPIKVHINQGTHIVAVAADNRHSARVFDVRKDGQAIQVTLPASEPVSRYLALSERILKWQGQTRPPTGTDIGKVLRSLDVRFGLILPATPPRSSANTGATAPAKAQNVEIWALGPGEPEARLIGVETVLRVKDVVLSIRERAHRWDRTGPDPNIPLLRESPNVRTGKDTKTKKHKWWVYATIIGAVALGTTVYLANDLAEDRQRIELTWP